MKIHFISFMVVDEDVLWQKPVLHDVSGSYQSGYGGQGDDEIFAKVRPKCLEQCHNIVEAVRFFDVEVDSIESVTG